MYVAYSTTLMLDGDVPAHCLLVAACEREPLTRTILSVDYSHVHGTFWSVSLSVPSVGVYRESLTPSEKCQKIVRENSYARPK